MTEADGSDMCCFGSQPILSFRFVDVLQKYVHIRAAAFRNIQSILSSTDTSYLFSLYQIDFLLCTTDAWLLSAVSAVTVNPDLCI